MRALSTSAASLRHRLAFLLLGALCLCLPACLGDGNFGFLGYTTAPNYNYCPGHATIRVPIFQNKTYYRDLEFALTEALVTAINKNTPYRVVSGDADMEITGTILTYTKADILQNPLNEIRMGEMTMTVDVVWRDLRTGEILSKPRKVPRGPNDPELVPDVDMPELSGVPIPGPAGPITLPTGPSMPGNSMGQPATLVDPNAPPGSQPPPLPLPPGMLPIKPQGILVRSTVDYIPELGPSNASARQAGVIKMANHITQMMEKPW